MDTECEAYPMVMEGAEEELQSDCALFRLHFQVYITHVPYDEESGDLFVEDTKIAKKEYKVWACGERMSREMVRNLLEEMGIPVEPYMVTNILECAQMMMVEKKKILEMGVVVDVPGSGEEEDLVYYPNASTPDHQW